MGGRRDQSHSYGQTCGQTGKNAADGSDEIDDENDDENYHKLKQVASTLLAVANTPCSVMLCTVYD